MISGRLPRPGSHDMMVGVQAARKFAGLEIGDQATIANVRWRVVGIFQTGNNLDGDAVADADALKAGLHRLSYDVALLSLKSPSDLGRLQKSLRTLPVMAIREKDYYARLWQVGPKLAFYTACTLLLIIGGGALAATTHSVYAAVEARAREIVILRAIGFDRVAIAASVMLETMLVAWPGRGCRHRHRLVVGRGLSVQWRDRRRGFPRHHDLGPAADRPELGRCGRIGGRRDGHAWKSGRGTVVEAMREL